LDGFLEAAFGETTLLEIKEYEKQPGEMGNRERKLGRSKKSFLVDSVRFLVSIKRKLRSPN